MNRACNIKQKDPSELFTIVERIGKGAFGAVFKTQRISDGKQFALKYTHPKNMVERQDVINECSLIKFLNCDQLIKCEEVYDY